MTKESLTKAKMVASRLSSGELGELSKWATDMSGKRWKQEKIKWFRSIPVGTKLVLGHISNARPAVSERFSGRVVTLSKHGRTRALLSREEDGRGILIPYAAYHNIKGEATDANLSLAKAEVDLNRPESI